MKLNLKKISTDAKAHAEQLFREIEKKEKRLGRQITEDEYLDIAAKHTAANGGIPFELARELIQQDLELQKQAALK
jgi:hypothetical protein